MNTQDFISNPTEIAKRKLDHHKAKGENSRLSIFEVANLMDQVVFKTGNESSNNNYFEFCFN